MKWYYEVNDYCKTLSELYDIPLIKVSGILSALSPNNTFKSNVKSLERFLSTKGNCKVSTYNQQKEKALMIYNSSDNITEDEVKSILGKKENSALKTKAFFENIFRPETSQAVTIDLWMIRHFKIDGSLTPKKYKIAENKIKKKAKSIGVMPHELQAKIWVELRGAAY